MSLVEIFHLNMLPKSGGVGVAEKVRFVPRPCENSGVENQTCMRVLWFVIFLAIIPNN